MSHAPGAQPAIEIGALPPLPPVPSTTGYTVLEHPAPSPMAALAHDVESAVLSQGAPEYHPGGTDVADFLQAMLTQGDPRNVSGNARAAILYFAAELQRRYTPEGMQ